MTSKPALEKMLGFIDTYQQQRSQLSSINVVRSLRAYTRPSYASQFWELAAGKNPDFIKGELDDQSTVMMCKEIDHPQPHLLETSSPRPHQPSHRSLPQVFTKIFINKTA
ncbi:MAG: hypothetical protein AAGF01_17460 [Cyanobacteria bacterium P01_G01_bin.38]